MVGIAIFAVGILFGFPGTLIAVGLLIFASRTRRHRGGTSASLVALVLALVSAVLTSPITVFVLSSSAFYNRPATRSEIVLAVVLLGIQVFTALGSVRSALRHRAHLRLEGAASVSPAG